MILPQDGFLRQVDDEIQPGPDGRDVGVRLRGGGSGRVHPWQAPGGGPYRVSAVTADHDVMEVFTPGPEPPLSDGEG